MSNQPDASTQNGLCDGLGIYVITIDFLNICQEFRQIIGDVLMRNISVKSFSTNAVHLEKSLRRN
ncbi:hypothetical protein CFB50_29500 [Burkholderia sp. AU33423]|nr:hypothetical protein CFB50_29500 [Burkholderia sp. AU33423]